ncbi:hypothetical protein Tco_1055690 [Tanacetum coccineum]|uniref:Uncharacterized protein n=1 Tax=Tanacetum coccineum TaxID=301880 RepID=A0ABQ5H0D3_9ASTR
MRYRVGKLIDSYTIRGTKPLKCTLQLSSELSIPKRNINIVCAQFLDIDLLAGHPKSRKYSISTTEAAYIALSGCCAQNPLGKRSQLSRRYGCENSYFLR